VGLLAPSSGRNFKATKRPCSVSSALLTTPIPPPTSRRCGSAKLVWPIPSLCGGIILGAKAKQVNVLRGSTLQSSRDSFRCSSCEPRTISTYPYVPLRLSFWIRSTKMEGRTWAGRRHDLFYGRAPYSFPRDGSGLAQAFFEEMFRPSAGRHGGVLTETQNYQFCLRIVCVGRRLGFIHGLCGNDFTRARRIEICHATRIISGGTGESGYVSAGAAWSDLPYRCLSISGVSSAVSWFLICHSGKFFPSRSDRLPALPSLDFFLTFCDGVLRGSYRPPLNVREVQPARSDGDPNNSTVKGRFPQGENMYTTFLLASVWRDVFWLGVLCAPLDVPKFMVWMAVSNLCALC